MNGQRIKPKITTYISTLLLIAIPSPGSLLLLLPRRLSFRVLRLARALSFRLAEVVFAAAEGMKVRQGGEGGRKGREGREETGDPAAFSQLLMLVLEAGGGEGGDG